jgi:hypothetical protein
MRRRAQWSAEQPGLYPERCAAASALAPGCLHSLLPVLKSDWGAMRQVKIRAHTNDDAERLMPELAQYAPKRSHRSVSIELDEGSQADLLGLLAAVETCLRANEIRSVRVEVDDHAYLLAPS